MGDRVRVRIDRTPPITAEVPPAAADQLKLDDGGELWATVPPHCYHHIRAMITKKRSTS